VGETIAKGIAKGESDGEYVDLKVGFDEMMFKSSLGFCLLHLRHCLTFKLV
jgi:hypothetical protein